MIADPEETLYHAGLIYITKHEVCIYVRLTGPQGSPRDLSAVLGGDILCTLYTMYPITGGNPNISRTALNKERRDKRFVQ